MTKPFMKIKEAAQYFSVSKDVLYRAIKKGELRAYKPNGRDYLVKVIEVEKWIESKIA
ncbi:excisionase family DNA-binding protein [Caldicoprobacter algeriensis]|uniref:excisionase family DNA-binding protein n=1 Tax=Caldicoprobacter algeriensis TaxID=699281 RepID=UPI00207A2AED|nr:excisionase family DNA-binding protein [Caldicoprobacter algeriensis]MCM8900565.1 excisionase family DNA-binding protein [Caldicoprobacter algeriensis]